MTRPFGPLALVLALTAPAATLGADEPPQTGATAPVPPDGTFPVDSNLKAGVAKVDITPPASAKVVGHVRPTGAARDPIRAAVLLFDDGRTKAALVTYDLIEATDPLTAATRKAVSEASGTPAENVLVAASHNHSAAAWEAGTEYGDSVIARVKGAAAEASKAMRPVSIGYAEGNIHFSTNRRKVIDGRAVLRLDPQGPNDTRVKVLRIDDGTSLAPVAVVMHALCHPCVFTWGDKYTKPYPDGYPFKSADFPGEAQRFVEMVYGAPTKTLFLQGCSGNIRPNLPGFPYRCGDEADMRYIGRDLGCEVVQAADHAAVREERAKRPTVYPIKCARSVIDVPGKTKPVRCEFQALRVGPYLFLTIPGEPFVEYAMQLEKAIADRAVPIVVGYANGGDFYVPTAKAFQEGGYEPNMTPLGPGAEAVIVKEVKLLADRVIGDIFDAFAPTIPKDYTPELPAASTGKK